MTRVLYIADSRGFALRQQVYDISLHAYQVELIVLPKAGATIQQTVAHAFQQVGNQHFDIIYLSAGVNDLSIKYGPRDITPVFDNRYDMVSDLLQKYYKARILLDMLGNNVVICELIGLNYQLHNIRDRPYSYQQKEVDAGIILLNEYIRYMNAERLLYSPNITEYTHKQRETNNLVHRYRLTMRDGIHLRWEYSSKILDRIIINVLQILGIW